MKIVKFGSGENIFAAVKILKRLFRFQTSFLELLIQNVKSRLWFFDEWQKILESKVQPCARVKNWSKLWKLWKFKIFENFEIHATNNWRKTKFRVNPKFSRTFWVYSGMNSVRSIYIRNRPFSDCISFWKFRITKNSREKNWQYNYVILISIYLGVPW